MLLEKCKISKSNKIKMKNYEHIKIEGTENVISFISCQCECKDRAKRIEVAKLFADGKITNNTRISIMKEFYMKNKY